MRILERIIILLKHYQHNHHKPLDPNKRAHPEPGNHNPHLTNKHAYR